MPSRRAILMGSGTVALAAGVAAYTGYQQMGSMDEYTASVAATRAALNENPDVRELIRYATLAANSHNAQPWLFRVDAEGVEIRPDFARSLPAVDPDHHHLFASLGCAVENFALAAAIHGSPGSARVQTDNDGAIRFSFMSDGANEKILFDAIPTRQTTRAEYDGRPVTSSDLETLAQAAMVPGVDLTLITDRPQMNLFRDLVVAGNTIQMEDASFVRELKSWMRFSPSRAMQTGDGLFSALSGNPTLPDWLGSMMFSLVFKAGAENDKYARQIASSAGIAVFAGQKDDPEHWVLAGRSCQRFALQATALGLRHAFINQPVEVPSLRPELAKLAGLSGRRIDLVMRFGYGPQLPFSARRPVEAVLV